MIKKQLEARADIDREKLMQLLISPNDTLVQDLMSKDYSTQMAAVKMLLTKLDVIRLVQLKESLKVLEDTLIDRAIEDKDAMDIKSLMKIVEMVNKSAGTLAEPLMKEKKNELVPVSQIASQTINNQVTINLPSDSRNKIRDIMTKLLSSSSSSSEDNTDVTDVTVEVLQ